MFGGRVFSGAFRQEVRDQVPSGVDVVVRDRVVGAVDVREDVVDGRQPFSEHSSREVTVCDVGGDGFRLPEPPTGRPLDWPVPGFRQVFVQCQEVRVGHEQE